MSVKIDPFNVTIMDVHKFIKEHNVPEVTTTLLKVPSSSEYHPHGLFSEDIFGLIGSDDRLTKFGYITLNCKIITPVVLRVIKKIAPWHLDVMAGTQTALYDKETKMLIRSNDPKAETGYSFYMKYYPTMVFPKSDSLARQQSLGVIDKFRKLSLIDTFLVEPAGLRELSENDSGRLVIDDINKLYIQLLGTALDLPPGTDSPLFDPIKFQIQSKAFEIYSYLENTMTGKKGFITGHYTARRVALGTRNVISSLDYSGASPDDPQFLKANETRLPLFQTMKGLQPIVYHILRKTFLEPIFSSAQDNLTIPAYDTKTFKRVYIDIDDDTRAKYMTPEGATSLINRFRADDVRQKPVMIKDVEGHWYYLSIVCDLGDEVIFNRTVDEVKEEKSGVNKTKFRGTTWCEIFYIATWAASVHNYAFITRYPVTGDESCYPTKIHLVTTDPARVVRFTFPDGQSYYPLPQYPILGRPFLDGVALSAPRLGGLGADHDGDTISVDFLMSEEGNKECEEYLKSPRNVVDTQGKSVAGAWTDLNEFGMAALTYTEEDL